MQSPNKWINPNAKQQRSSVALEASSRRTSYTD